MELVSVIMPVYNREKYVAEAVQSILNQTYKYLEFIIIDDGSTDSSVKIVKSFNDERIKLHVRNHKGVSAAANFGMRQAKSDLIARIDSDDYADPERLEKQVNFLSQNLQCGILGTNFIWVNEKGNKIKSIKLPECSSYITDTLPRNICVSQGTLMYRKHIVTSIGGYDETKLIIEDWDIYLKLIGKTIFHNLQEYLTYIRLHPGNLSINNEEMLKQREDFLFSYYLSKNKSAINNNDKAKANFDIGYFYYYENNLSKAQQYLKIAVGLNPKVNQYQRYYYSVKLFPFFIKLFRRYKLYIIFDLFRRLDKNNLFFRIKF